MNHAAQSSYAPRAGASPVGYRVWVAIAYFVLAAGCGIGLSVEFRQIDENLAVLARERGSVLFRLVELTRDWNAGHGGVYVPVTGTTRPNPYLDHPRRDVQTTDGMQLTMVNPAFMTRQIAEIAEQASGVRYHITSLKPIRPANRPDEWETAALQSFEAGRREVLDLVAGEHGPVHRYMAPLIVKKPCLACHAGQGYREGDIRGGISVSMPADKILAIRADQRERAMLQFGSVALVLGFVLHFVIRRSRQHFLRLQEISAGQERLIDERTQALSGANERLVAEVAEGKHKAAQILESEARYRSVIDTSQSAILIIRSPDATVEFANERAVALFGMPMREIVGQPFLAFVALPDRRAVAEPLLGRMQQDKALPMTRLRFNGAGGGCRVGEVHLARIEDCGQSARWVVSIQDVTERLANERALLISAAVMENAAEGIVVTDAGNRIIQVNPAFVSITGFQPEQVLGKDPKLLASGRHDAAFFRDMWQRLESQGRWAGELWNRRPDGTLYFVWLSIALICGEGDVAGGRHVATFIDITQRKAVEESLRHRAQSDPLTDLPNRALFIDRLHVAHAQARRYEHEFALLYVDLDHFKEVNDSLGHAAGDQLLVEAAGRLQQALRDSDTVARIGGDEFAIILPQLISRQEAEEVARRVVASLARPFDLAGGVARISASIGIAIYPLHGREIDTIRDSADAALYVAKGAGRNTYRMAEKCSS